MKHIDRRQAARLTRAAQALGLLLLGGVVGAYFYKPAQPEPPVRVEWPSDPAAAEPTAAPVPAPDPGLLGNTLDIVGHVPPQAQADQDVAQADPDETAPSDDPAEGPITDAAGVRYLGGFFGGGKELAIISSDLGQQLARLGDKVGPNSAEVTSITPEAVEFTVRGVVHRVTRQKPAGAMVTSVSSAQSATPATPMARRTSVAPGTVISDEARDRLARRAAAEFAANGSRADRERFQEQYQRQRDAQLEALGGLERENPQDEDQSQPESRLQLESRR
jgi:hypothetical protein